jgi:hypothetical protein
VADDVRRPPWAAAGRMLVVALVTVIRGWAFDVRAAWHMRAGRRAKAAGDVAGARRHARLLVELATRMQTDLGRLDRAAEAVIDRG